jgi:type II secretory pathway pseudopilin PulG
MWNVECGMAERAPLHGLDYSTFHIPHSTFRSRGFSFTEIMFAVIILGIGFIMVAAIFPVAIQQAKNNTEETSAAVLARGASNVLPQLFKDGKPLAAAIGACPSNCPPPLQGNPAVPNQTALSVMYVQQPSHLRPSPTAVGPSQVFATPLYRAAGGNLIFAEDPRFAYMFLYRRRGLSLDPNTWAPYAQVYIIPVQSRNTTTFRETHDVSIPGNFNESNARWSANLQPREVQVAVVNDVVELGGVDLIAFDMRASVAAFKRVNTAAAVEGGYVIIANDRIQSPANNVGRMNGMIYRLGARHAELDGNTTVFPGITASVVYELQPGNDFTPDPGNNGLMGAPGSRQPDDICALGVSNHEGTSVGYADSSHAFLIGRGYSSETLDQIGSGVSNPTINHEGAAMPIGVYTTFVKVN